MTQPPASAVRKFLSLLEQSDLDFTEEIECQKLKSQVVQQIRSNQQLEQDLRVIDLKIGLLVKNRLTIQVIHYCSYCNKYCRSLHTYTCTFTNIGDALVSYYKS